MTNAFVNGNSETESAPGDDETGSARGRGTVDRAQPALESVPSVRERLSCHYSGHGQPTSTPPKTSRAH
ncbi:uncharacterized protein DSM5745_11502 [Aspergillus mulundensis]|uniref:Uncharacterized protein n=1 Tax=Aspergillus mulundensis TaxID=1810919 RepID=A0A3D8Q6Z6_9EURO|nr:hypothetical protein DSM5745_11502 [Aspergillus mulundensis]RDW57418.1 hypothetical protein DSM5745_11502 [Aspergillus mulundensis]